MKGITRRAIEALGWSYVCVAIRIAVQAAAGIVLAHLLGPRPFGLVAAAWALVGVGSQFVDLGFSAALVQRPSITDRDVRFVFTAQVAMGCAFASLFALAAPLVAAFLHDASLTTTIRWLCLALLAQAFGQTAHALLRRNLDLKTAQIAQTAGVLAGYLLVSIPMAVFTGQGALALALGIVTQIVVSSAWAYAAVRHSLTPAWGGDTAITTFGLRVTAINLVNWLIGSLDNLVMSRAFGATALGFYNRAQSIGVMPPTTFVGVVQSVLFPAYSRRTDDAAATQRAYITSIGAAMLAVLPAVAVVAVVPGPIVTGLLGPAWLPAAPMLVLLACAMPWYVVTALSGPLLWSRGQVQRDLKIQASVLVTFAILLVAAAGHSPLAIAGCFLVANAVRAAAMWACAGVPLSRLSLALRAPVALAMIAGGCALIADHLFRGHLGGIVALVGAGMTAGLLILRGSLDGDLQPYRAALAASSAGGSQ